MWFLCYATMKDISRRGDAVEERQGRDEHGGPSSPTSVTTDCFLGVQQIQLPSRPRNLEKCFDADSHALLRI